MNLIVVDYGQISRWDVKNFFKISWNWPEEHIKTIGEVAQQQKNLYRGDKLIPLLSIHFDGSMTERPEQEIKGKIFIANKGDLVYSKIDLRNGAIGIVSSEYKLVGFTSEFPIYKINESKIKKEFIKLVLHSKNFRGYVNAISSGTSGRKRINPEELESIEIPVPPLAIQEKIIETWVKFQKDAANFKKIAEKKRLEIEKGFLEDIGIKKFHKTPRTGAFIIDYKDIDRWDTFFFGEEFRYITNHLKERESVALSKCAKFISRSWSDKDFPTGFFNYIQISDVDPVQGITGCSKVDIKNAPSRATQIVKEGDLIISTTRPYLASFTKVSKDYDNCVASSGFSVIESTRVDLDKDFLLSFLKSYAGLKQFEQRMTGGLYPAIVQGELEKIIIPIPPLKKQKEIVKIIEADKKEVIRLIGEANNCLKIGRENLEGILVGSKKVGELHVK